MADYRTIITATGQTKLADAIVGPALTIQTMAVGDANGVGYDPDEAQADLVNAVYTANVDSVETLAGGVIVVEMTVPANEGGFHVREAGIFDSAGDLIAVARIADRYKPLPASGQADELTVRMKLDVGNVGNVDWVVDLTRKAKIDGQLRPDYRSVEAFANDPPGAPVAGETWIVGAAPTGAFVGHENELAEWSGTGWTFVAPTPWMLVGLADRTDWRWDHTLGAPEWVLWEGTETIAGPVRLEPLPPDPTSTDTALTPAGAQALRTEAPPSGYLRIDGKPAQAIANNVHTTLTWNAPTADTENAWSAAGYTCPRAGILFVRANATIERATDAILTGLLQIHVNGAMHQTGPYRDTDSSAAPGVVRYLNALVVDAVVVGAGDVVTITAFQQSSDGGGADINTSWNETSLTMYYVGGPFA